jgi:hypothetical protein
MLTAMAPTTECVTRDGVELYEQVCRRRAKDLTWEATLWGTFCDPM